MLFATCFLLMRVRVRVGQGLLLQAGLMVPVLYSWFPYKLIRLLAWCDQLRVLGTTVKVLSYTEFQSLKTDLLIDLCLGSPLLMATWDNRKGQSG